MDIKAIKKIFELEFPWQTQDPFLFCVYHEDFYPKGTEELGPSVSLDGRNIGNDFLIKDGFRMYHGRTVPGFPAHPHRGFETITVVRKGLVDHADSAGGAGRYGNGDVQWMTAGKGLQHSEMFPLLNRDRENPFELFQIWINLPKKDKFADPHFKMLWRDDQAKEEFTDINGKKTYIEIVAGKIKKKTSLPAPSSWAANPDNEVLVWNIKIEANGTFEIPVKTEGVNRSLYFYKGSNIFIDKEEIISNTGVELNSSVKTSIINGKTEARLLLLQGKPINEPVVQHGPFVMNSNDEISQAITDYHNTHFGGWPWNRTDKHHGPSRGRFAQYPDGTLEEK